MPQTSTAASSSQGVTFMKTPPAAGILFSGTMAFINSIDGVEVKAGTLDTTSLNTIGGYKTFISGFRETSDLAISGFYSSIDHDVFMTDFNAGTQNNYGIQFPKVGGATTIGTTWFFVGIIIGFKTKSAVDSVITFDATIKIVGQPTISSPV